MIICGLDLSTTSSGISIIKDNKLIYNKNIQQDKSIDVYQRIYNMQSEILKILKKYHVNYVAIEDVALNASSRNLDTAKKLLLLVGGIIAICGEYNINWKLFMPSSWRHSVGVYQEKKTREEMKREYQKMKSLEIANKYFDLNLTWTSLKDDDKNHYSDLAESALIALAMQNELGVGDSIV